MFDDLLKMTDQERLDYLDQEAEKIFARANPNNVLKLRAIHARLSQKRKKIKNRYVAAQMMYHDMLIALEYLNDALKGTVKPK
jgi:hypothetical protein